MSSLEAIDPNSGPIVYEEDLRTVELIEQQKAERNDTFKTLGYVMLLSAPVIVAQALGVFPLRS